MTRKEKQRKKRVRRIVRLGIVTLMIALGISLFAVLLGKRKINTGFYAELNIRENLLTPNPYSRPGTPLNKVAGIVVHYTANPGSSASGNRDYFENLSKQTGENAVSVSSHFVVGLKGEIVQCLPLDEISYASNHRNKDTISIECCHPDKTGKFNPATYNKLVRLTTWLCVKYGLTEHNIIRHYDVTGKACPKYFVDHEDAWKDFKKDVRESIQKNSSGIKLLQLQR